MVRQHTVGGPIANVRHTRIAGRTESKGVWFTGHFFSLSYPKVQMRLLHPHDRRHALQTLQAIECFGIRELQRIGIDFDDVGIEEYNVR